jgi:hypothetical protein
VADTGAAFRRKNPSHVAHAYHAAAASAELAPEDPGGDGSSRQQNTLRRKSNPASGAITRCSFAYHALFGGELVRGQIFRFF